MIFFFNWNPYVLLRAIPLIMKNDGFSQRPPEIGAVDIVWYI